LDKAAAAWDIEGMKRDRRDARRSAPHAGLGMLLLLLVVAAAASAACRGPQVSEGVGGQSGDEGRRMPPSWLGTGGVSATPAQP
jgi:hypothetical protein